MKTKYFEVRRVNHSNLEVNETVRVEPYLKTVTEGGELVYEGFYAMSTQMGCGKLAKTEQNAIILLCQDHGYFVSAKESTND